MAQVEMKLTVRLAWWVVPYLKVAALLAMPLAWFADDEQIENFVEAQSAFVISHGIRFDR